MERRTFLKVAGASAAASAACEGMGIRLQTLTGDVPVRPEPSLRPGIEKHVDTICGACAAGCGIRVRLVDGNAVQVEGLSDHPVNEGGLCPRGAAEIQNLHHPERLIQPLARVRTGPLQPAAASQTGSPPEDRERATWETVSWEGALGAAAGHILAAQEAQGEILFVLGPTVSPAETEVATRLAQGLRGAGVVRISLPAYDFPADAFSLMLGARNATYDLPRAGYILTIQSDWLQTSPSPVEVQRAFAGLRRSRSDRRVRMVHAGSRLSITALKSDKWIPIRPLGGAAFAHSVAAVLLEKGLYDRKIETLRGFREYRESVLSRFGGDKLGTECGADPDSIREVAEEFGSRHPAIAIGRRGSLAEQSAVVALNLLSGSVGVPGGILRAGVPPFRTAHHGDSPADKYLQEVVEVRHQWPRLLVLYKANPLIGLADSRNWEQLLKAMSGRIIALGSFQDESALAADLILPLSTPLESRAFRWGSTLSGEPVLSTGPAAAARLESARDGLDVLFDLAARTEAKLAWKDADGFLRRLLAEAEAESLAEKQGTWTFPAATPSLNGAPRLRNDPPAPPPPRRGDSLHLEVYHLLAFPYGEGAHLPYLHGLTAPSGREAWSSWVEIHPDAAQPRGIRDGDRVEVRSQAGALRAAARLSHGIHPSNVAMPLGLGRRTLGEFAEAHGADPAALLAPSLDPETGRQTWEGTQVEVRKV